MTRIPPALVESPASVPSASGSPGDAADAPVAEAFAALLAGVPLPTDPVVATAPIAAEAEPEPLGGRVDPAPPAQAFREQARGIVLTRATRPIGVPADATALPLRPPAPTAESATAVPATASFPSLPIGLGAAAARPGAPAASPPADPATTPPPATVAGAAVHAQSGAAEGPPPAQATPAASVPTFAAPPTAAAPALAAPPGPVRAVGLEHAVETVRLALRHGAERGVSHARISLTPRELGTIEVHLRHTPDGLVARVVAEHAGAAQQLQQAGAELRRSLEQQGVTLLRLDIGASGHETAGHRGSAAAFGEPGRGRRQDAVDPLDDAADAVADETTTTLQLPNGALVDVLA